MVVIVRRIIYFFVIVVGEEGGVPATMVTSSFTLGCETDCGIFVRQIRTKRNCDLWQRTIHPNCFWWTSSFSFFKDSTCVWCEIESPPKRIQSRKLEDQHCGSTTVAYSNFAIICFSIFTLTTELNKISRLPLYWTRGRGFASWKVSHYKA